MKNKITGMTYKTTIKCEACRSFYKQCLQSAYLESNKLILQKDEELINLKNQLEAEKEKVKKLQEKYKTYARI